MSANQYVALLRGINVGGNNQVSMADLRAAFEAEGFDDVRTYINSGNVLFSADSGRAGLEDRVEEMLRRRLGIDLMVVVRSRRQLENIIRKAPEGFGEHPDLYHSDVVFVKAPLTPARALGVVELREEVDQAWAGTGVLYFARLSARRTQSKMSKIMGTPEYKLMTIRSWSTTTRLRDLWEKA
ncbi:MAG TPA: DUF1697 domain-containing protein [Acidimicrobiia bacterium]|nr:DUF1697 domain-containing protein [Acidimicrobiia bacterium]